MCYPKSAFVLIQFPSNRVEQGGRVWHNSRVFFSLLSPVAAALLLAAPLQAQEPAARKVNASRLVLQGQEQRAYLTTAGKAAPVPFTGVAFVEESWGRAELTYSNGILHGPVVVVANNKVLSQFEYVNGKKVLKE